MEARAFMTSVAPTEQEEPRVEYKKIFTTVLTP